MAGHKSVNELKAKRSAEVLAAVAERPRELRAETDRVASARVWFGSGDEYELAAATVRRVIHEWDPYDLIGGGAPADEWECEIASVVAVVPDIGSPADAAAVISRVFSAAFEPKGFGPSHCATVEDRLYSELRRSGVLKG